MTLLLHSITDNAVLIVKKNKQNAIHNDTEKQQRCRNKDAANKQVRFPVETTTTDVTKTQQDNEVNVITRSGVSESHREQIVVVFTLLT